MPKILIPTALRQFTEQQDTVEVGGGTVGDALAQLIARYPNIKQNLFTEQGTLRSFVNVYVDDEDIRHLNKDATKLEGNETISIVPSIAGGAGSAGVAEPPTATLSNEEVARYSRHLILPEVGMNGQLKLKQARVALIGAGGLGAPLGLYLAAAGVGRIGLVDFDVVDASNLQRQVIHGTKDIGRKKLDSAAERMLDINPALKIEKFDTSLTSENALDILKDFDIVIDGTDNFPTRYLVNDACVLLKKPNVYGSIFRFEGQATVFAYEDGPCYRCLYPEPPPPGLVPSCAEGGVLGILPGIIGVIQATEAVKIILCKGETLKNRLLLYDALNMRFRELRIRRDPNCPACGDHPTITKLIDYQEFCGVRPTADQAAVPQDGVIDPVEVKAKLDRGDDFTLIDVREPHEYQIARIPGAVLIPLGELPKHLGELDPESEIVAHCKSGGRSQKAVDLLKQNGFRNVRNMTGGITAWSDKVDPAVPKY
ncbi:MAG: molybdopterin-synthase adenylyltransferase MoeB [Acidobacteriaceae bacterium]|nr:molybdopterin-synthase adenylyltransferase MoeB [Acidobacteriaceae bacterium]MBV9780131.1 molybdopterin-synthase adenylyltransferase MoeB [Acidobacteriaceae bacterium]